MDIDKDGENEYTVHVAPPVCAQAKAATEAYPSDVELPVSMSTGRTWNTDWDIDATVTDTRSGAAVRVRPQRAG